MLVRESGTAKDGLGPETASDQEDRQTVRDGKGADSAQKPKVLIVGSGISGLSAAWFLSPRFHTTLIEERPRLGMGRFGAQVDTLSGSRGVDMPVRIFNNLLYPFLSRLCEAAAVPVRRVNHAASYLDEQNNCYFRYTNFNFGPLRLILPRALPAQVKWGWFILNQLRRIRSDFGPALMEGELEQVSVEEFFKRHAFPAKFRTHFFEPVFAAICTCSISQLNTYPVGVLLRSLLILSGTSPMRRFIGGTSTIEQVLAKKIDQTRLMTQAKALQIFQDRVELQTETGTERFDHVVFATQAHRLLKMQVELPSEEKRLLSQIDYSHTRVVVHKDEELFGPRKNWNGVIYQLDPGRELPGATAWINAIESGLEDDAQIFQTVHPPSRLDDKKILAEAEMDRPVPSSGMLDAVHGLIQQQKRSCKTRRHWYVGSYLWPSLPLLETGVRSAWLIAGMMGCRSPKFDALYSQMNQQLPGEFPTEFLS